MSAYLDQKRTRPPRRPGQCTEREVGGIQLTGWSVRLQSGDHSGLSDLIGTTVLHVHRSQEKDVTLLCDTRGHGLHDLAVDGLFIVGHQILIQELLNLIG